jgi:hypothetical protein
LAALGALGAPPARLERTMDTVVDHLVRAEPMHSPRGGCMDRRDWERLLRGDAVPAVDVGISEPGGVRSSRPRAAPRSAALGVSSLAARRGELA